MGEDDVTVPIEAQIVCVKRELTMRARVYPRQVLTGRMNAEQADRELEYMQAVLETLQEVAQKERLI